MWKDLKKSNKDYNFWLDNEMDDYYLDAPESEDIIHSLEKKHNKGKSLDSSLSKNIDIKKYRYQKTTKKSLFSFWKACQVF